MKKSIKILIKGAARLGIVWPFVLFFSRVVQEVKPDDGGVSIDKPVLLALNPDRFVSDLNILANSKYFRILKVSFKWQTVLLMLFWPSNISSLFKLKRYYNPEDNESLIKIQKQIRKFMKNFLRSLYSRLNVNCVIGAGILYPQDYEWGLVSNSIGVPYVVMHRENLYSPTFLKKGLPDIFRQMNKFAGEHIIVHNEMIKSAIIDSGIVNPEKISSLGCLRMDEYCRRIRSLNTTTNSRKTGRRRKKVAFFSFTYASSVKSKSYDCPDEHFSKNRDSGFIDLFEHVHVTIAKLSVEYRDTEFVIKAKWGGKWIDEIEYVLNNNGYKSENIDNLTITSDINAQDLIIESDVICSFSSTTVLEAAIAGKPVIIPNFDEASNPVYSKYIRFKDEYNIFDIADSVNEFEELVINRLKNPEVSEGCMQKRYELFEKYVSSMEGDALDKYVNVINQVIKERRKLEV